MSVKKLKIQMKPTFRTNAGEIFLEIKSAFPSNFQVAIKFKVSRRCAHEHGLQVLLLLLYLLPEKPRKN